MNTDKQLRVVILSHGGCEHLIELLSDNKRVDLIRVCVESPKARKRSVSEKLKRSFKYDGALETLRKFGASFLGSSTEGSRDLETATDNRLELINFCEQRGIQSSEVENYHLPEFKESLRDDKVDLGILYGTNIIRKAVFTIPKLGSINIHQGLAPHYRGGPTVFWELFNNEDSVGITVHFVAPKVDTGDIIVQESIGLTYDFERYGLDFNQFLEDSRARLREPSARLMANAVDMIARGSVERKAQDTSIGKRYRIPTFKEKQELIRRLRNRMKKAPEER